MDLTVKDEEVPTFSSFIAASCVAASAPAQGLDGVSLPMVSLSTWAMAS